MDLIGRYVKDLQKQIKSFILDHFNKKIVLPNLVQQQNEAEYCNKTEIFYGYLSWRQIMAADAVPSVRVKSEAHIGLSGKATRNLATPL